MKQQKFIKLYVFICAAFFLLFNSLNISVFAYSLTTVILIELVLRTTSSLKLKTIYILAHLIILTVQINYTIFLAIDHSILIEDYIINKIVSIALLLCSFLVEYYFQTKNYQMYHFPNTTVPNTISFNRINEIGDRLHSISDTLDKTTKTLNREVVRDIFSDISRNNSFTYLTNDTLSEEYFKAAYDSLSDPHIYIAISDTGSNAGKLISLVTDQMYNHASISFDRDLKTLVSYNGGERVYPPGLNPEIVDYLQKKPDASILVYKLAIDYENKIKLIEKINQINTEGSAYNLLGLVLKQSYKPNIMFCSQFVYHLLKYADIAYFEREDGDVTPTDLVALDYYRKLKFDYEIKFSQN